MPDDPPLPPAPASKPNTTTTPRSIWFSKATMSKRRTVPAVRGGRSKFTDALHGLSRALQDLNRFDEAIVVAQQISAIDPDDILAHTSLSILYQKRAWSPRPRPKATRRACWAGSSS